MQCPACKKGTLKHQELETGLKVLSCHECQGCWIPSYQYWRWRDAQGKNLAENPPPAPAELAIQDNTSVKLCPECGHILIRYPVGHGCDFRLDRCGHCGGMWFDSQEWDALKRRNLHKDVHLIFSEIWQHQVRNEQQRRDRERFLEQLFGREDFRRIKDIKVWLKDHPHGNELYAFLNDREL